MKFFNLKSSNHSVYFCLTTDRKIQEFKKLPDGWHFGKGKAPIDETIASCLKINSQAILLGFATDAFPGVDGEIQVNCYNGDETIELTIEEDGKISLIHDKNNDELHSVESLELNAVFDFLKSNGKDICNTSESSIQFIMKNTEKDFPALPLKTPLMAAEYQLFHSHV